MNICLTGATGFIGKHLLKELMPENNIYVLIRPASICPDVQNERVFIFNDNIKDLISFFVQNKIDGVVHLASLYITQHTPDNVKNLIDSNIFLGTAILEAATKANVKWFLNTGTYWQNYIVDSKEYFPVNLYAATKQAFIDLAKYYVDVSLIRFVTLKIPDTYGVGDTRRKIFSLFKEISNSEHLRISIPAPQSR